MLVLAFVFALFVLVVLARPWSRLPRPRDIPTGSPYRLLSGALVLLSVSNFMACGEAEGAPVGSARASAVATTVVDGFDTWGNITPANCQASPPDPLSSWCTATAPPDGWSMVSGRWGDMVHRAWETHDGFSALSVRGCATVEPRETYCGPVVLRGPPIGVNPGTYRLSYWAKLRGGAWYYPPTYVVPPDARVRVVFFASDCTSETGRATVEVPPGNPKWEWFSVAGSVTAPAGSTCAKLEVDAGLQPRGVDFDTLTLSPL